MGRTLTNITTVDPYPNPSIVTDEIKHRLEQGYILHEAVIIGTSSVFPQNAHNTLMLVFISETLGECRLNIRGANFGFNGNGPKATVDYIFEAAGGEEKDARKELLETQVFVPAHREEHVRKITLFK